MKLNVGNRVQYDKPGNQICVLVYRPGAYGCRLKMKRPVINDPHRSGKFKSKRRMVKNEVSSSAGIYVTM